MCSKYQSLSDGSRSVTSSASYINDDSKLNETDWYVFKNNNNYLRIPTTCVPENRCGATAPGHMQGDLPTVGEGIVKRKVCFHSNENCCHYSVDIYVRNCYMFYVYNLKRLDESWTARHCAETYSDGTSKIASFWFFLRKESRYPGFELHAVKYIRNVLLTFFFSMPGSLLFLLHSSLGVGRGSWRDWGLEGEEENSPSIYPTPKSRTTPAIFFIQIDVFRNNVIEWLILILCNIRSRLVPILA